MEDAEEGDDTLDDCCERRKRRLLFWETLGKDLDDDDVSDLTESGRAKISFMNRKTHLNPRPFPIKILISCYLIIMHKACSSCRTLSKYIISRSDTMAPLITMISSLLMIPEKWQGNAK